MLPTAVFPNVTKSMAQETTAKCVNQGNIIKLSLSNNLFFRESLHPKGQIKVFVEAQDYNGNT